MVPGASRSILAVTVATLSLASAGEAQQRYSLDVARKIVGVGGVDVSPDGKTALFTVVKPNFTTDRNEVQLWAVELAGGAPRNLTPGRRVIAGAHWAPDGKSIAFLAPDSASQMQIWILPMNGGEARKLTAHPTGVEQFSFRPDGGAIAYAAEDEDPKKEGEQKFNTTFEVGAQDVFLRKPIRPQHIWVIPFAGGESKRITSGAWTLEFVLPPSSPPSPLSWSPDGTKIAFAQTVAPESGKLDSTHVAIVDVATGTITPLTSTRVFENNPVWSPDGKQIAYWQPRDGRGDIGWQNEVYVAPATGGAGRSLTRGIDHNLFGAEWMPDGKSLLVAGNAQTTTGVWIQPLDGAPRKVETGELVVNGAFGYDITVAKTGALVFTATSPTRPSELYVMDTPTSTPRRLTDFNGWAADVAWGKMERVTWKSDQFEADGTLTFPPNFDSSKKYPLVLVIHGGPQAASKMSFNSMPQMMAAEGLIVFQPNYRGSDNLGNAYQAAIWNDAGAGPGRDVMAGVALLRARPYVDRTRTAVTGWSYGGYMTSWLIGNYPNEWTAAMAGAPVTNWEEMYNLADGSLTIRHAFGGSPWTGGREKAYQAQSPITYARKIKAPTLVMSNMEDFRVPPTQAMALYRAMKDNGVETKFVGFQGRTHASGDPVNARERTKLWVEWVKEKLLPKTTP
ncbi:MAG: S9 family peptidase [Gemmatimonadetes bacterium]|nr:S9 family peptidase [Gemmatimonadota bacterium]